MVLLLSSLLTFLAVCMLRTFDNVTKSFFSRLHRFCDRQEPKSKGLFTHAFAWENYRKWPCRPSSTSSRKTHYLQWTRADRQQRWRNEEKGNSREHDSTRLELYICHVDTLESCIPYLVPVNQGAKTPQTFLGLMFLSFALIIEAHCALVHAVLLNSIAPSKASGVIYTAKQDTQQFNYRPTLSQVTSQED